MVKKRRVVRKKELASVLLAMALIQEPRKNDVEYARKLLRPLVKEFIEKRFKG